MKRQRGFTLIEVLLALAIFAALSISAFQVLQGMMRSDSLSERKVQRLMAIQNAFSQLERDFTHIVPRRSRGNRWLFSAARHQLNSEDWGTTFIRSGWPNPLGMLPRSELQYVAYRLRQHQLERLSYRHADPIPGAEPLVQPLLDEVSAFRLRFYSQNDWQDSWHSASQLPRAVEITLTLPEFGEITRRFLLTPGKTP